MHGTAAKTRGPRALCLMHANCQGDPLAELLSACPAFAERYVIRKYTNFRYETIPPAELASAEAFIFQWMASAEFNELMRALPGRALRLPVPSMLFTGYWPFWTPHSPQDFGDSFLDKLIDMGLNRKEILHVYLHTDVTRKFDLQAMLEESAEYERVREARCVVQVTDFILRHFRQEHLLSTIAHPRKRLVARVADAVLDALGLGSVPPEVLAAFPEPYADDLELPIHPQVAAFHQLSFAAPGRTYQVYNRAMTFEEYTARYVDCRLLGLGNFIGYLQLP